MSKPLSFTVGMPTQPDVKRLREKFNVPDVGTLISYTDISETIGYPKGSSRFETVFKSWRKELYREHNIVLRAEMNRGYWVADPSDRVHISFAGYKHGMRKVFRSGDVAQRTITTGLSPDELRGRDHVVRVVSSLRLSVATAAREYKLIGNGK